MGAMSFANNRLRLRCARNNSAKEFLLTNSNWVSTICSAAAEIVVCSSSVWQFVFESRARARIASAMHGRAFRVIWLVWFGVVCARFYAHFQGRSIVLAACEWILIINNCTYDLNWSQSLVRFWLGLACVLCFRCLLTEFSSVCISFCSSLFFVQLLLWSSYGFGIVFDSLLPPIAMRRKCTHRSRNGVADVESVLDT